MYPSRIVGVGNSCGDPMVSFTLSSKSIPYRQLNFTKDETRANVFPKVGFEDHPTNQDPEVDHYSSIVTGKNKLASWAVAFNGHMAKRTHKDLEDGMNPFMSLDLTLLGFRGARQDARIRGIVYIPKSEDPSYWLGVSNTDTNEKHIRGYPNPTIQSPKDKLYFIYDKNTTIESCLELDTERRSPDELAKYVHENLFDGKMLFGLATGVAVLRDGKFNLGIYNNNFNESTVERWKKEYSK